ncbi:5-oxoprolinase subunit PxpB [Anoxybacteroides tepidamans]|uniref:5-oxoprolinase subunit PxpB n=1 Tax=Anoxybacteroides tepidamans TaxID=265948 RepID=UPI0004834316|nr:5-oxoprolinase subunit PxpB [Anoxybacillus tepidamans]
MAYTIFPLCENALTVRFSNEMSEEASRCVQQLASLLGSGAYEGIIDIVPAFSSVTIYYDPLILGTYKQACSIIKAEMEKMDPTSLFREKRTIVIPVCYGGEFGPDLPEVARYHCMAEEEVIRLHSAARYKVYMIGFAPGFAYLGGLPSQLAAPRRAVPRLVVPAGSVGIAGSQTGVYPFATPGGWQIIGRTPLALFHPNQQPPSLLQAGDIVQFRPIDEKEYRMWGRDGCFRS